MKLYHWISLGTIFAILFFSLFETKKKRVIFFIGPPTSGKTTVAKWCAKQKKWEYVSTEHMCLDHVKNETKIGQHIKPFVLAGELVPDDIILPMLKEKLEHAFSKTDCVILESFPRTLQQAQALDHLLQVEWGSPDFFVVKLCATDEIIVDRIQNRFICPACKKSYIMNEHSPLIPKQYMTCDKCECKLAKKLDDEQQSIKERIKIFRTYENQLLAFYQKTHRKIKEFSIELHKNNPLEKQFQKIVHVIEKECA